MKCINFGINESSHNLFLNIFNLYLVKFEAQQILKEQAFIVLLFSLKANLDKEKTNQLGESSPNFNFVAVNLDPILIEEKVTDGES